MATSATKPESSLWQHNSASSRGEEPKQQQQQDASSSLRVHMQLSSSRKRKRKAPSSSLSGSSSSSSSSDEEDEGWRVKLYRLNADGSWDDCGTGRIVCLYKTISQIQQQQQQGREQHHHEDSLLYRELGEPTLVMHAEASDQVLLRTKILLRDAYQRQGDNIITWCEPYFDKNVGGVDLALSFQDNAGCLDIWRQITNVQSRAAEWFRRQGGVFGEQRANPHHHAPPQQQQHQQHFFQQQSPPQQPQQQQQQQDNHLALAVSTAEQQQQQHAPPKLPNPPSLANLEEIADTIAAAQVVQLRDQLALYIAQNDCLYLKSLLGLFGAAEAKGDYGALATLAACIKTILLLNDVAIIELIVAHKNIFENVCSALEYDPDLRDKANHRWFIRERAKFRTVVKMEDEELIATIHRSFRVTYLRDTLLRPTMDEGSLSTLTSLQTFTHAELVKGVTTAGDNNKSYLDKILSLLRKEIASIIDLEWQQVESPTPDKPEPKSPLVQPSSWKQHLAPQDESIPSRKIRKSGCLYFLRELFNMVKMSLQQNDKDDFFAALVHMLIGKETATNQETKQEKEQEEPPVYLLTLLGAVLSDPTADVSEKGAVLEIVSTIAMHDPNHIRQHCLDLSLPEDNEHLLPPKPMPNPKKQVIFHCPTRDLLLSLLFLLAVETDAGILLQTSEILRIVLDTDLLGEPQGHGVGLGVDDTNNDKEGGMLSGGLHSNSVDHGLSSDSARSSQNQFLSMFYENYVHWLVVPFQCSVLHPIKIVPPSVHASPTPLFQQMLDSFQKSEPNALLHEVPPCAVRNSFAVELLNFCVRAHLFRMKFFLMRSRVLGSVLKVLTPSAACSVTSGDRCLKLAAIRFLRAILSMKDEHYHRHIIQHNLFQPVFEAFRANPVGDNLVSSAIIEMCDYIHTQNIKSLIEYIVSKHLIPTSSQESLEDVATPYVNTLTELRKSYEDSLMISNHKEESANNENSRYFSGLHTMNKKAMEDQRKFRQADEEESYFDAEDDDVVVRPPPVAVDDVIESELHRTPRMFSLATQAPLLNSGVSDAIGPKDKDAQEASSEGPGSRSEVVENSQSSATNILEGTDVEKGAS